jgi:GDSL-like Lipase/Acylhydrolase family
LSEPGSRRVVFAVRIALAVFAVALSLAASEAALRLFGCQLLRGQSHQSAPFLAENRYWGVWHYPNHVVDHQEACFRAQYRTNSLGMKGPEVRPGTAKIALLGDSFVEGLGNDNDATVDQVMQRQLSDRYDVLNFGISGGFTTVDELALYENFARHFDPRVVVLFFVNYNDLQENLQSDQDQLIDHEAPLLRPPASFADAVAEIRRQVPGDLEKPLPKGWCLRHLYRIGERAVRLRMQAILHFRWDFRSELERVYLPKEDPDITRAWEIVEAALRRLQKLVREGGATLVVVDVADPYQVDPSWLRLSSARAGATLDPLRPNRRLGEICRRSGILFYDQYPDAKRYIDEHGLGFPYLSYACDRHYDNEGQELMGRLVVRFLRENDLIEP